MKHRAVSLRELSLLLAITFYCECVTRISINDVRVYIQRDRVHPNMN